MFGLNAENYSVNPSIQSKYGKTRRKTPYYDFSRSAIVWAFFPIEFFLQVNSQKTSASLLSYRLKSIYKRIKPVFESRKKFDILL